MDLNRVDLNLLVAFDALMAERNVTRAAERLSIGQSAMSSTLGRLRKLFNDPVLERDGRRLRATPLAESLEGPVRDLLSRTEAVLAGASGFDPGTTERDFAILTTDFVLVTFLQPLLALVADRAPHARLTIRTLTDDYLDQLSRGQVDAVIAPREVVSEPRELNRRVLFQDRYVCAVDIDHPDVGEVVTRRKLAELPYLAWAAGSLPSLVELQFDLLGIRRHVELTTALGVAPFMLRGTRMITVIPSRLARWCGPIASVRTLEPPVPLPLITETLFWSPRLHADPGHRWLRSLIDELVATESMA